ncbi:hypothetical protein HNQ07_004330 [Deinococcus metalli]|uniref:Uncharacterized protein n=1 Tax=Deinococcus metalli TaxID=1141878 RepID=A0A7W8KJA7_9DEIO|nr:permease prefix domain 1-containing protein [Deinococcus metalli]MBB5378823.1 hypothetical protein [Deinococcus metalli]
MATPPRLLAYLRRATLGLPRHRRQELWDELEDHLLTRSRHLQASGHSPDAALGQALTELGAPTRVSVGMGRVFQVRPLTFALGLLMASATLLALRPAPAPEVLNVPSPLAAFQDCAGALPSCLTSTPGDVWLQPEEVAAALKRQGVQASVNKNGEVIIIWQEKQITVPTFLTAGGQPFVGAATLTGVLMQVEPRLRVWGYNRMPILQAGSVSLTLSPAQGQMTSAAYYRSLGRVLVGKWMAGVTVKPSSSSDPLHRLTTALAPGEVVMLVTRNADGSVAFDVTPVGTNGRVRLHSPHAQLTLVTTVGELRPTSDPLIPALLVRLTNVPLGTPAPDTVPADLQP